jgi:hypothetical protein
LQVEGRSQKSIAGHRRILAAIKRRDAEAAKAAMRRHIKDIEEIVLKGFEPGAGFHRELADGKRPIASRGHFHRAPCGVTCRGDRRHRLE